MILTYRDKHTHLQSLIETDDIFYIAYHSDIKRAIVYLSNGFQAFNIELGELLLPITKEDMPNLVYTLSEAGTHFLVNIFKVREFKVTDNDKITVVKFINNTNLEIANSYLFQALQRTEKLYEAKNNQSFHFRSIGDS